MKVSEKVCMLVGEAEFSEDYTEGTYKLLSALVLIEFHTNKEKLDQIEFKG